MKQSIKVNKKRLLATIIICLFSVISIGTGKIFSNYMNIKNDIASEQNLLFKINQHIEQELPIAQHQEWLELANSNSIAFLKLNSINNNIKQVNISNTSHKCSNLYITSLSTILPNLISSAKAHLTENTATK